MQINNSDYRYQQALRAIDNLRQQGKSEQDPEMLKARIALRDLLEERKKNKHTGIAKVVPRLTAVKTVRIDSPRKTEGLAGIDISNKYVILGMVAGVIGLLVVWLRRSDKPGK